MRAPEPGPDTGGAATSAITGDYTIDPAHSRLGFSTRHAMVTKVTGHFTSYAGTAHVDVERPDRSSVELSIDAGSVATGWGDRDDYLRDHAFFGGEGATLTFSSTAVDRAGTDWTITGDLTMKGVTRSIDLVFTQADAARDPEGRVRIGFTGSLVVNRSDWGLNFATALETGGVLVSEKVTLTLEVSAVQDGG